MVSSNSDDSRLGDISQILTRLTALEGEVQFLRELLVATVHLQHVQCDQLDEIEQRDEDLLFHRFTSRYYSEVLFDVKIEYEVEIERIRQFGSVILDLAAALPNELREDIESRLEARPHTVRRRNRSGTRSREVRP